MNGTCETCRRPWMPGREDCGRCGSAADDHGAEELDFTVVRPQGHDRSAQALLLVDDGTRIPIDGSLLLGRAPRREMGSASVILPDAGMTVSKTHVRIAACEGGVAVTDLRSTNGVRVVLPGGQDYWLEPGEPEVLSAGARVQMGARSFTVADADGVWEGPEAGADGGTMVPVTAWPMLRPTPVAVAAAGEAVGVDPSVALVEPPAAAVAAGAPDRAERRARMALALVLSAAGCAALLARDPVIAVVGVLCIGAAIHLFRGGRTKTHTT